MVNTAQRFPVCLGGVAHLHYKVGWHETILKHSRAVVVSLDYSFLKVC